MLASVQEVDVVFRPEVCEVYDDVVLFKALDGPNAGGFNVPVRALLPTLQVTPGSPMYLSTDVSKSKYACVSLKSQVLTGLHGVC